jgi:hypothetical protein
VSSVLQPGAADVAIAALWPAPRPHVGDPVGWCEAHGIELWSGQAEMLRRAERSAFTATAAGHGTSKSHTAALWIAYGCTTLTDVYYLHTCPTAAQLQNILRPLREIHRTLGLPGYITDGPVPEWKLDGRVVYRGRAAADTGSSNLAGPHAENMRVVVDEADGMAAPQWGQIMGMLTGDANRMASFGNPVDPASAWRTYCEGGVPDPEDPDDESAEPTEPWDVAHVSVLDTPAFTGEKVSDALRKVLPSKRWLRAMRAAWGEGSALWASRVLGLWPDAASNAMVPLPIIDAARRPPDHRDEDQHRHGDDRPLWVCDVADDGSDRTVVARIVNREFRIIESSESWSTTDAETYLIDRLKEHPGARVVIDCDGIGAAVRNTVQARGFAGRVLEFKAGRKSTIPDQHHNLKSEAWWALRDALGTLVRLDPTDPYGEELRGELGAIRYVQDAQGRINAEKKDETKKRLGRSPDLGDTLMMGVWGLKRAGSSNSRPKGVRASPTAAFSW